MAKRLAGLKAVVTGGSDGIGLGIATASAAEGADVWIVARRAERLAAARDALSGAGGEVRTTVADLADPGAVDAVAAAVYLASAEAKWVTGTVLIVDGGLSTN